MRDLQPDPRHRGREVGFRERALHEAKQGVKVSVAVLTPEETERVFARNLQKHKMQPVWLRIQNDTDEEFILLTTTIDPDYFSPHETSWKNHYFWGGKANKQMDDYYYDQHVSLVVHPRSVEEGYVSRTATTA